eukprot:TRINITY_DN28085_c0_g1_i1.p1 TRINITY_DN28085_c0_g1~~TRINITY_DN28085_c0_g1_i1.p1  ORF type:complete len:149 (-),score=28.33 TRINITY_DN28085_c0_g1_i1:37-483(-)
MSKFGGGEKCARCLKTVYANEKSIAAGKNWHTACLKCPDCNKRLDATILTERDGEVYCKACYGKKFGPKGFGFGTSIHTEGQAPVRDESTIVKSDAAERAAAKQGATPAPAPAPAPTPAPTTAPKAKFCSNCGNPASGNFCAGCGNKL